MGKTFYVNRRNKGAALIVVIMVIAVMTILGIAILNISLSETIQASNEDKRIQAHYLARSGAEATLSAWEDAESDKKPSGKCNPVYLNNSNEFVYEKTNTIGKFEVIITKPDSITTVITSEGTVGNVQQTVTVTIKSEITQVEIPLEVFNGHDLGWYYYNSGQIHTDPNRSGKGKAVKLEAKNGKGLKIPNKNSPAATFEADQMLFISPIQILHNSIILSAKLIAFNGTVDFSNNGNGNGALVLKVLGDGFKPNGSQFNGPVGVVFFQNDGYYFKNIGGGVILKKSSDIQSQVKANNLEKIKNTDPNFKNTFPATTTQTIKYSSIWS